MNVDPHIARKALTRSGIALYLPEVYRGVPISDAHNHAKTILPSNFQQVDLLTGIYGLIENPHNLLNRSETFANYYVGIHNKSPSSQDKEDIIPYPSITPYEGGIQLRLASPNLFKISKENKDYGQSTMGVLVVPPEIENLEKIE